jgi:hypothetical protein
MNAYIVSHTGIGDNLFMSGGMRFLLKFYEKVHLVCNQKYYPNVHLFFIDEPRIVCVPFDKKSGSSQDEIIAIKQVVKENCQNESTDLFVCGFHKTYLQSKITNRAFIEFQVEDNQDTVDFDTLTSNNYKFLWRFYDDLRLNFTIFVKYFYLHSTEESKQMYDLVKSYNIVFIQYESSDKVRLNISNLLKKYLYDKETILICNDINLYSEENEDTEFLKKRSLCENFIYKKIIHYTELIKNSQEIYIIDSCFTGIVLPFVKQGVLKATTVRIIRREVVNSVVL